MITRTLIFCLTFVSFGCHKNTPKRELPPVEVTTRIVKKETVPITLNFIGVMESSHSVDIWSRVEGYLNKIDYVEGAFVKEGDLLFEIDPRQFEASVNEAKANLQREEVNLDSAQKSVNRFRPLFEEKAASRKELEDAESQLLTEQAMVSLYQAKLDEAELNLGYTKIASPISGYSTAARYSEGTLITPGTTGHLTTIYAIDPIYVAINVSDYYLLVSEQQIARGELTIPPNYDFTVRLTLADGTEYPELGRVSFISPALDPNTGTLSTKAVFPNPKGLLKPGQFVQAAAIGATRPNAILVPQISVQQGANGRYVYLVNKEGKAEMRLVETGDWIDNDWIITSGLFNGDEVIVDGVNKIESGTLVKVIRHK